MLKNDFDKTFELAFYNSFLKIKSNYGKENMFILKSCSFQKMLSSVTCVLISLLLCVLEDLEDLRESIMAVLTQNRVFVLLEYGDHSLIFYVLYCAMVIVCFFYSREAILVRITKLYSQCDIPLARNRVCIKTRKYTM